MYHKDKKRLYSEMKSIEFLDRATVEMTQNKGVQVLHDSGQQYFCAKDIGRVLNFSNIRGSVRYFPAEEMRTIKCKTKGGPQICAFLTADGVRRLLCASRKDVRVFEKEFGLKIHANHYICIESASIDFIWRLFDGKPMVKQFLCRPYRIDLYFPQHRVAVECDETAAHGKSRISDDAARQRFIEGSLDCVFIRFRPQEKNFCLATVCNSILRALERHALM